MTFNLSNKDKHPCNDMITVLNANFAQVSATQTEGLCKLNHETQSKTNKGLYKTKQRKVMPTIQ